MKFITTLGQFLPSYNRDATAVEALKLTYRTSGDQPDEPFVIDEGATYIVKVDLLNLTLTLTETEDIGWRFDEFFIVGSFTGMVAGNLRHCLKMLFRWIYSIMGL